MNVGSDVCVCVCHRPNTCVPPKVMLNPSPPCDGTRGCTFDRQLGLEAEALLNEINVLIKGTREPPSSILPCEDGEKTVTFESGGGPPPATESTSTLIFGFPAPIVVRSKCLMFVSHLSVVLLLRRPQWTEIASVW